MGKIQSDILLEKRLEEQISLFLAIIYLLRLICC